MYGQDIGTDFQYHLNSSPHICAGFGAYMSYLIIKVLRKMCAAYRVPVAGVSVDHPPHEYWADLERIHSLYSQKR